MCVCVCVCHNNDIFSLLHSLKYQFSSPLKSFCLSTEASDLKTSHIRYPVVPSLDGQCRLSAKVSHVVCTLPISGHTVYVNFIISFV